MRYLWLIVDFASCLLPGTVAWGKREGIVR